MSDDPYQPGSKEDFDRLYRTSYPKVFRAQLRAVGEVLRRLGRPAQPPDPADQATRPDLLRALRTIPPKAGRGDRPSGARTESPEPSESPEAAPTAGPTEKPEATNSPEAETPKMRQTTTTPRRVTTKATTSRAGAVITRAAEAATTRG